MSQKDAGPIPDTFGSTTENFFPASLTFILHTLQTDGLALSSARPAAAIATITARERRDGKRERFISAS
jgi:hypothetical protein